MHLVGNFDFVDDQQVGFGDARDALAGDFGTRDTKLKRDLFWKWVEKAARIPKRLSRCLLLALRCASGSREVRPRNR